MLAEGAVELAVGPDDLVVIKKSAKRHRDVHANRTVALAQDKPVARRHFDILRIDVHRVVEQACQHVRHRHVAAHVDISRIAAA